MGVVVPILMDPASGLLRNTQAGEFLGTDKGGTGASTPAAARASLGLEVFTSVGDAAYTILPTDRTVGLTAALTASRTWTLPAANSLNPGGSLRLVDTAGSVSANNKLTIAAAGSDTLNGAAFSTFTAPFTDFQIVSDGVSKWTYDVQGLARGGTGATSAAGARTNLGAAASGANSDITSLSGLTTALSTAQGGIGTTDGTVSGLSVVATGGTVARKNADRDADRLNVKSFGAKGDGVTDDSAAIAAAISRANALYGNGQQIPVYAPAGRYRIAATALPQFQGNGAIQGDGTNQTYFVIDKIYSGDVFSWSEAWMNSNYFQSAGPFVSLSGQKAGPKAQAFTIVGDLSSTNIQNALMLYDRADMVNFADLDVMGINGRGFACGLTKAVTAAYMRESAFARTRFWACGTASLPAVEIGSNGSSTDDATNEVDWSALSILDAAGRGLVIRNQGARGMRDIRINGLRVEGPTGSSNVGDLIVIGDPSYTGKVSNVFIDQLQTNGVSTGYSSLTLIAPTASSSPANIVVQGTIGNGAGKGLNIQAGIGLRFDLTGIGTTGTQVTLGATPLVGQDIVLNGLGAERYWTYSIDASLITAGYLRSYGAFRTGDPSSPATQALVARPHDSSASGGLPPGSGAVDLQLDTAGDSTRVASGQGAFIGAGQGNRAGGSNSVQVGGQANINNSFFGVGGGGQGNTLSNFANTLLGGTFNNLSGSLSVIGGGAYATDRSRYGWSGYASGRFSNLGDAQDGKQVLRGSGSGTSAIRLTSDGAAAGSANVVNLAASACSYQLRVCIQVFDTTNPANTYAWSVPIAILTKTGAANSTTVLTLGTPVTLATNSWAPTVSVTADTTNGGLNISVTPPSGNTDTIHAVARVESVEVQ